MAPAPTLPVTLRTADGVQLHLRHWPRGGDARGTVLLVHGLGEHIGRYEHVAAQFNGWGWHAVGYDQRGHGRSEGARGRLPNGESLLDDLSRVIDATRVALPGPLLLLGHSMGGLVAARFVAGALSEAPASWSRPVDALVLSSPALVVEMNAGQRLLLAVAGRLAPNLAVGNGLDPNWISHDPQAVQRYVDDPLVHDRITPRLARFLVDGGLYVVEHAADWRVSTLLMWAGADRCVAPAGSAGFAAAAPQALVAAYEFRGLYHEIFNEPEQADVFAVLGTWLQGLGPAASQS